MSAYVSVTLRQQVINRAEGCCEYCHLPEAFSIYHHEIDHLIALKHGGLTAAKNFVFQFVRDFPNSRHPRSPFVMETGWLVEPNLRKRMVRNYGDRRQWVNITQVTERNVS